MADPNGNPITRGRPATPRWVKVLGLVGLLLIVLIVIAILTGAGGDHGPGRHAESGDVAARTVAWAMTYPTA